MRSGVSTRMQKSLINKRIRLSVIAGIAIIAVIIAAILFANRPDRKADAATNAYIEYINGLDYPEGYNDYPYLNYLRFALGYVDNDDIPELFLAYGDTHVDQISVYTYDSSLKSVQHLGDYGSFGGCGYYERQDVIFGQYGGQGLWLNFYEGLGDGGKRSVLAIEGSNAGREDYTEYYWASPYGGTVEEARQSFDISKHVVTEDEWKSNSSAFLRQYDRCLSIDYDNMIAYSEENLESAWKSLDQGK